MFSEHAGLRSPVLDPLSLSLLLSLPLDPVVLDSPPVVALT